MHDQTMPRQLTSHQVGPLDQEITIEAVDAPGPGGAHHLYRLWQPSAPPVEIPFQKGGFREHGINGFSIEALLAICEDRLACFQAGPFSCRENALALTHIQEAMLWLQKRTRDRMQRGVEGKLQT